MKKIIFSVLLCCFCFVSVSFTACKTAEEKQSDYERQTISQSLAGNGSQNDPFEINTYDDFTKLSNWSDQGFTFKNIYFVLSQDISFPESESSWKPIGNHDNPFQGIFNGQNHSLKNFIINEFYTPYYNGEKNNVNSWFYFGIFGLLKNATIKDLSITDISISITRNSTVSGANWNHVVIGGLSAISRFSEITNVHVSGNINTKISIWSWSNSIAGLLGYSSYDTIYRCSTNMQNINNNYYYCDFYSCYAGFIGDCTESTISNCYSSGLVKSNTNRLSNIMGGFIAQLSVYNQYSGLNIYNNYSSCEQEVFYYNDTYIITGGFIGRLEGSPTLNNFYNNYAICNNISGNYSGGFIGKTNIENIGNNYKTKQPTGGTVNNCGILISKNNAISYMNSSFDNNIWDLNNTDLPTLIR